MPELVRLYIRNVLLGLLLAVCFTALLIGFDVANLRHLTLETTGGWLAILMLALLPLQFSWAAVAAYCGHETGQHVQHLGHHEHQHTDEATADQGSAPADQSAPAGFDFDCGHCHGTCASMPAPMGDISPLALASHPVTPVEGTVRTLAQSPPERPQWLPLA